MSFIITMHVREGIVMASDSRLTFTQTKKAKEGNSVVQMGIGFSDSNYKTFLTPQRIGISIAGQASIQGVPLAGYVESLIQDALPEDADVETVAQETLRYFQSFEKPPETSFHVAGYKKDDGGRQQKQIWQVSPSKDQVKQVNQKDQPGLLWGGEGDILARIIKPVAVQEGKDKFKALPYHRIPFEYFTLQDAIDFAIYAIRTTIDSIRFLPRPKTVGGPIDVLVIKPDQAFWVQRKQLHGEN